MKGEMARGAAWMVLFRLFDRSIGIISTAVLARLLLPADFGLVAMAMSVIAVIELATAFSFEIALIQKKDPQRGHFDTAWTLNLIVAAGGAVVTAALAWPAAWIAGAMTIRPGGGAVGHLLIAVCLVAAFQRGHRALAHNARYHFTTWRWGRVLVMILAIGYALKLAILVSG